MDFEQILPNVLADYVPVGFKGILIAALIASFMSTFVSTVNSGAAYVVNDIYKRYLRPDAPPKRYVALGWITSSAGHHPGHRLRLRDHERALGHRMDRVGPGAGLRRPQRAQVALVAIQRLRVSGGHGRRHGRRRAKDLTPHPPGFGFLPSWPSVCRLGRRLPADRGRKATRCS